ncbi:MAG: hypothetical protein DRP27_06335 [Thermotogae bacterium]|nr:MAG: hypothetical protein DRP27_06335 [Thermotogota bacterium]
MNNIDILNIRRKLEQLKDRVIENDRLNNDYRRTFEELLDKLSVSYDSLHIEPRFIREKTSQDRYIELRITTNGIYFASNFTHLSSIDNYLPIMEKMLDRSIEEYEKQNKTLTDNLEKLKKKLNILKTVT